MVSITFSVDRKLTHTTYTKRMSKRIMSLHAILSGSYRLGVLATESRGKLTMLHRATSRIVTRTIRALFPRTGITVKPSVSAKFCCSFRYRSFSESSLSTVRGRVGGVVGGNTGVREFAGSERSTVTFFGRGGRPCGIRLVRSLPRKRRVSFCSRKS